MHPIFFGQQQFYIINANLDYFHFLITSMDERLTRVPRVREVRSLHLGLAIPYKTLQTVRHCFNIYASS